MKQASVTDVFLVFLRATLRYKWRALFILACSGSAIALESTQPWLLKWLFDLLEVHTPTTAAIDIFLPVIALFSLVKMLSWLCWRLLAIVTNRFQPVVMADMAEGAFDYLLGHSYQFFADTFAGSLVKKVGRLSRAFETFADEVTYRLVPVTIILIAAAIGLFLRSPLLAGLFAAWIAVYLLFVTFASRWAVVADTARAELDSEVGGALADAVSNAVTTKLFPAHDFEREKLNEVLRRHARAFTRSWDRHEVIFATQGALMILIEIVLMYLGVRAWIAGALTLGDLAFIQTFLALVFHKVWEVGRSFRHIFDSYANGKEMVEILNLAHGVRDTRGAKPLTVPRSGVTFQNVTFAFSRAPILERFSLAIKPQEKVALVGPSGAGKSTITKLLFRFYDVQEGKVLIDGQDIARVTQDSLRSQIALVPQEPVLFHRTLMENIRYGRRDATDEEVMAAARQAHCDEFIAALPKKYGTYVGERGIKLSGGERQRVAIARAILKNAPILVLDEATSSLDSESEALIQDSLRELMHDKTVIAIAHRLSTIIQMDRIVVVERGHVVATGTHQELLRGKGTYANLWNIQAGGFLGADA
ncbi:MAG: ABC transporter ATP-binding protein [Patescibacteria group bacterium]